MIQLQNISVTFAKGTALAHRVFHQLQLTIQPGECITVIGGNGAGKSTLMNAISGDVMVDQGKITLDNCDVTNLGPEKRAALLSRVFQDPLLGSYTDLTVEENLSIAFFRGKQRSLKPALSKTVRDLFQAKLSHIGIGLENRLQDKMGLLSGGQRQAISLVMATLQPSKILLLDEHTAALDPKMEQLVLDFTTRIIQEEKLTALLVTHCMSQALTFGTRTLVMHQGSIVHDLPANKRNTLKAHDLMDLF